MRLVFVFNVRACVRVCVRVCVSIRMLVLVLVNFCFNVGFGLKMLASTLHPGNCILPTTFDSSQQSDYTNHGPRVSCMKLLDRDWCNQIAVIDVLLCTMWVRPGGTSTDSCWRSKFQTWEFALVSSPI